jgi:hypothetical protein
MFCDTDRAAFGADMRIDRFDLAVLVLCLFIAVVMA